MSNMENQIRDIMSNMENQIRDLREKNSELALEIQTWKIQAAQKDREKLELTKENNELRLKLSILRSTGATQLRKLDGGIQTATEEALSYLVQASSAVARTLELTKLYKQERQELDSSSPKWSHVSGNTNAKRVNEVPPLLLGGQSIQPVVSLSRTLLHNRSINRSPNQNSGVTQRALPMHMLQDVYIPLTRIDAADLQTNNIDQEENNEEDNSAEDLGLEDSTEQPADEEESMHLTYELEESNVLDPVLEESIELEEQTSPSRQNNGPTADNPLEGPSWLLDAAGAEENMTRAAVSLEPDSTTPCDTPTINPPRHTSPLTRPSEEEAEKENEPLSVTLEFTPTVRRRKRNSSPPPRLSFSPRPPRPPRKLSTDRVLKVVVAKMRLSDEDPGGSGDSSPPKRQALAQSSPNSPKPAPPTRRPTIDARSVISERRSTIDEGAGSSTRSVEASPSRPRFDAPSPNGATDSGVIVCETNTKRPRESRKDNDSPPQSRAESRSRPQSRSESRLDYSDSDHSSTGDTDTRSRRTRKQVNYKEMPLNGETNTKRPRESRKGNDSRPQSRAESRSRRQSCSEPRIDYSDSDHSSTGDTDTRSRRTRKQVISYKEKPLNK